MRVSNHDLLRQISTAPCFLTLLGKTFNNRAKIANASIAILGRDSVKYRGGGREREGKRIRRCRC